MTEKTINLRGLKCPLPALRTRKLLTGLSSGDIIVIECTGKRIGLIVDRVSEVAHVPLLQIEPTPDILTVSRAEFLDGVGKIGSRLIILLNVENIINTEEY